MNYKHAFSIAALSLLGIANMTFAASARTAAGKDPCAPEPGAPCYTPDVPSCSYCLGPDVAPAVRPKTCNGDFSIDVAGFYWNAHQDGMEYAINNQAQNPRDANEDPAAKDLYAIKTLVGSEYLAPSFNWEFGFKLGAGYNSTHDGWDIGVLWTWYKGRAGSHDETESSDGSQTLLPIWSAFASAQGSPLYASDIVTEWKLALNLVDIELGREFWTSRFLTLRPHVGLRIAFIKQKYDITQRGGSYALDGSTVEKTTSYNDLIEMKNNFKGVGVRAGLDTLWNIGNGWGFYSNFAAALIYGRFNIDQDESIVSSIASYSASPVLQTSEGFRSTKAAIDLNLGIQWTTMFSNCRYGFTARLGWENHLFLNQNQLWRVMRSNAAFLPAGGGQTMPNATGDNVYAQSRGDLSTQGWTLNLLFEF